MNSDPSTPSDPKDISDSFTLLQLEPALMLAENALREAFQAKAKLLHPDQSTGDHEVFTRLNKARFILEHIPSRLKAFLALKFPDFTIPHSRPIPHPLDDEFLRCAKLVQSIDQFLAKKNTATSFLGRAILSADEIEYLENTQAQQSHLHGLHQNLLAELEILHRNYQSQTPVSPEDILLLHDKFSYVEKWLDQLDAKLLDLTLNAD